MKKSEREIASINNEAEYEKARLMALDISNGVDLPNHLADINTSIQEAESQINLFDLTKDWERLTMSYAVLTMLLQLKICILERLSEGSIM